MTVTTSRHGQVLVVRLDRPERRNAVDAATTAALSEALDLLEDDLDLRAGVLTGTAEVFSAGTDLVGGAGEPTARGGEYGVARRRRTRPLVAAVEGPALGGGLEILLACDLVVLSRTAVLGLPEVRLGLVARCGGLFRAPAALPPNVARELLLTGEPMTAERAFAVGLANRLVEPGQALAEAVRLAQQVAAVSPTAVAATMRALDDVLRQGDDAGWHSTAQAWDRATAAEDSREGVQAFLQRRAPRWTGR